MFLTIDHINNGGRTENKKLNRYGVDFYRWLKINNYPTDNYRLLCYNCNCARHLYGQCYHELCKEVNKNVITIGEYKDIILIRNINNVQTTKTSISYQSSI